MLYVVILNIFCNLSRIFSATAQLLVVCVWTISILFISFSSWFGAVD